MCLPDGLACGTDPLHPMGWVLFALHHVGMGHRPLAGNVAFSFASPNLDELGDPDRCSPL